MKRYVIIGNGVAGATAAEHIRKHDDQGDITILASEDIPFYYRIRLNEYISGDITEAALIAKDADWYATRRIKLLTRVSATDINPEKQLVIASNGDEFPYDAILIATGSKSFVPPIKGADKEGVFTLRTVDDARRIISFCAHADKIVLIGGGLLGLEAGNALRKRGKRVTVVEFSPRLLPRQLDEKGAARLKKLMEDIGFFFRIGAATHEITGLASVDGILLADGEIIPADMVVISAGVRPDLELGKKLGLTCDKGIVVDACLQTSRPGVFAAGDVAEFEKTVYGIWPAAMQQGKAAGINMAGGSMLYQGSVMANKLKVAGIELASAGEIDAENRFASRVEETGKAYKKIILDDNRIIGCIMLGDTSDFNSITRAMAEKKGIDDITG